MINKGNNDILNNNITENNKYNESIDIFSKERLWYWCNNCNKRVEDEICWDCGSQTELDIPDEEPRYWCDECNKEVIDEICPDCGKRAQSDKPIEVYWCPSCKVPIIKEVDSFEKYECPLCNASTHYLSKDLRPVFPEERLLYEILNGEPLKYKDSSVWNTANRYYLDGDKDSISFSKAKKMDLSLISKKLKELNNQNSNTYDSFNKHIEKFIEANQDRLNLLKDEAYRFIRESRKEYTEDKIMVSFSGGKDSTVVSDLVIKALGNPGIVHIFGNTTLEFPLTIEYANRFKKDNPYLLMREAKNKERDFYEACDEIGPPSRVMRWCCTMFKTGPINRRIEAIFGDKPILTFYGIRKAESVSRSKYERVYDSPKIKKQKVASPIFSWKDIDIWLYILAERIDFNDAYRLGYDRVGCWCCPNNNERAHFLSSIYMTEETNRWRNYLINFAKKIGKPDAEVYIDTGKWKARQGGYGIKAAEDVKIVSQNCTTEENSIIYKLLSPINDDFYNLFIPFGKVSKELGNKLLNEVLVLDLRTNIPLISIQPKESEYEYSVKIKTMNVEKHDNLQRMIGYQIRKYNACRKCLGCETVCKFGAIKVSDDGYKIDDIKCKRCKICVTDKHLTYGCLMGKYLFSAATSEEDNQ